MPRNIDKNGFKRFFGSRLFLVIALVVTILVAFSYARAYYQDYTIRQEIQSLQKVGKEKNRVSGDSQVRHESLICGRKGQNRVKSKKARRKCDSLSTA